MFRIMATRWNQTEGTSFSLFSSARVDLQVAKFSLPFERSSREMVAVYVTLSATVVPTTKSRVYALLLPDDTTWAEVDVQPSERAGFGLFPKMASDGCWSNASNVPIALPYIGVETVVHDQHSMNMLIAVLKGEFERLKVGDLMASSKRTYKADGLFAVPQDHHKRKRDIACDLCEETRLLEIRTSVSNADSVCYLLEEDARVVLHLTSDRDHLFELLCAHARHEALGCVVQPGQWVRGRASRTC